MPRFAPDGPLDQGMIVPLVKRSEKKMFDGVIRLSERESPVVEPLAGELIVMYAFDLPGRFEFVTRRDCGKFGIAPEDLRSLSVRNLRTRREKPQVNQTGDCLMFILDGDLEASLLLAGVVWEQVAPKIPGDLIAAVPSRDTLVVTGTNVTSGADRLKSVVNRVWASPSVNRKLLLTRSLLIRQGTAWRLLEP